MQPVEEKATILPNPHIKREQCIEKCQGCNKMYSDENIGDVCIAYADPKAIWRRGCALASNKKTEVSTKKKVNPLKWSKRRNRR